MVFPLAQQLSFSVASGVISHAYWHIIVLTEALNSFVLINTAVKFIFSGGDSAINLRAIADFARVFGISS